MIARFATWTFDSDRRLVTEESGEVVHLTPKAFDLLNILMVEAPRVVRKDELHRRLWPGAFVSDATLVGLVKEVRRAFRTDGADASVIRTSHGVGYAFAGALDAVASGGHASSPWIIIGTRRIRLKPGANLIGRDPTSDVWLDKGGVSRRHARIVVSETGALLEDLGSKNGTMLRGTVCVESCALCDGDTIRLGPVTILYRASDAEISTETAIAIPPATRT